jgi:hypothetical protein
MLGAVAVVAMALVVTGCSSTVPGARTPQNAMTAGAVGLLGTTHGVVWSFNNEGGSGVVLRSADHGRHWRVVLSPHVSTSSLGLVASYFLGPQHGWAAWEDENGSTSVYRTSDGGLSWHRSEALAGTPNIPVLFDQLFFADPQHGWLLGVGTNFNPGSADSLTMFWWRTDDGGRTWSELPASSLPLQGLELPSHGNTSCPEISSPHLAFATANVGFFTEGACEHGTARPLIWRTGDGGRHWTASLLPAPAGGWGRWATLGQAGADVGAPDVISSPAGPTILVPASVGSSRLVIERSVDMGHTWQIASTVDTRALPLGTTPADWFDPINTRDWVVAAPGGLIETTTAGRTWTFTRSPFTPPDLPASFTSPENGFVQGTGLLVAVHTGDGGRTWSPESVPLSSSELAAWSPGNAVSTVKVVGPRLAVAAGAAGLMISSDGGRTWVERLGPASPVSQIDFVNSRVGFAVDDGELLASTNGGISWRGLLHPVSGGVSGIAFWSARDGVAAVGQRLFLTSDGGTTWRPLRLPPGWIVSDAFIGGGEPTGVCFTDKGIGWAVASRGGRQAVLVTTSGGHSWRVALPSAVLPRGVRFHESAGEELAACQGKAAWVLVTQAAGPMDMQGTPQTFDLLRSLDLGRSWLDVLRSPSEIRVARPKIPTSPGGPQLAPNYPGPWTLTLVSPTTAWFTTPNEDFGGIAFGSTGDGGLHWTIHSFDTGQALTPAFNKLPVGLEWLATTASNAADASVLFRAPKGNGDSYLYATSNSGLDWHRLAVFTWPASSD